jgi:hypothetical protein
VKLREENQEVEELRLQAQLMLHLLQQQRLQEVGLQEVGHQEVEKQSRLQH